MENFNNWKTEVDADNIAWCYIDVKDSSANVLSQNVLEELEKLVDELINLNPRGVIFLSGKSSGFIAGAKIEEFTQINSGEQAIDVITRVHALFDRIENLAFPSLCLINGFCLGGGLEFALSCRYRIGLDDPATRIGLPEILLGIHPGFGGTVRIIREIGALHGMQLMLTGRTVDARKAGKLGLIDRAVPERQLVNAATALILGKTKKKKKPFYFRILNMKPARKLFSVLLARQVSKRANKQHYPAPYALIDLWKNFGGNEKRMLREEIQSVARLFLTSTSRNLVRLFLLQDRLKSLGKQAGPKLRHVHVIGAGVMGGDIAAWCALQGMTVTLQDREPKFIAPAMQRAYALFRKKLKQTRLVTAAMDRIIPDHKGTGVVQADIIIEAIIENIDAKVELFQELEKRAGKDAILATNTSSISLELLSEHLQQPERLVGIHFFNPVSRMQLVEVIHAENTSAEWVNRAAAFCVAINRLPLPVKSSPGFLVNRVLTPYLLESTLLIAEGVQAEFIDQAAVAFGMPMGPIELADTVGLDICLSVSKNMAEKLSITVPEELQAMVDAGKTGKKSGRGFYRYKKGKPVRAKLKPAVISRQQVTDRLVLRILNESIACLREGLVADSDLLDAGMVFGTGFAPFTGGPVMFSRNEGIETILEKLASMEKYQGDRFKADTYWSSLHNE